MEWCETVRCGSVWLGPFIITLEACTQPHLLSKPFILSFLGLAFIHVSIYHIIFTKKVLHTYQPTPSTTSPAIFSHRTSQITSTRNADYLLTTTNYHNTLDHPPSQHIPISIKASKSVSLSKQANQFLSLASYHDKTDSIIATKNRSLWFYISRVIHRIIKRVHFKPCRSIMLSEHSSSNVA